MTDSARTERTDVKRYDMSKGRFVYLGLKCNDCGERFEWNRNMTKRRKCSTCGCQWLELNDVWLPFATIETLAPGLRKWSAKYEARLTLNPKEPK